MSSLQDILADFGLADAVQTKTASAGVPAANEVEAMLKQMGLEGADLGVTKVASESNGNKGEPMSLQDIYGQLFDTAAPAAAATVEKTAAEQGATAVEEVVANEGSMLFGELTAHYLNQGMAGYLDEIEKTAGSVVAEAGPGELPLAHAATGGQLTAIIGSAKDPHQPMNHSASGGAPLKVTTGGTTPYSLKESVLKKAILKKMVAAPVGDIKD